MFWDKYDTLCSAHGMTPHTVASTLGISSSCVHKWRYGAIPRYHTLEKLASFFNITVTELLDDNEFTCSRFEGTEQLYTAIISRPELTALFNAACAATAQDVRKVIRYLNDRNLDRAKRKQYMQTYKANRAKRDKEDEEK